MSISGVHRAHEPGLQAGRGPRPHRQTRHVWQRGRSRVRVGPRGGQLCGQAQPRASRQDCSLSGRSSFKGEKK